MAIECKHGHLARSCDTCGLEGQIAALEADVAMLRNTIENYEAYAADLRELIHQDANGLVQGAMVGCPDECFAFAKHWIRRKLGLPFTGDYEVFRKEVDGD